MLILTALRGVVSAIASSILIRGAAYQLAVKYINMLISLYYPRSQHYDKPSLSLYLDTYHEHIVHLLNMQLCCIPPFAVLDLQ
jgi:hypothetical protein